MGLDVCQKCGTQALGEAAFCHKCGARLAFPENVPTQQKMSAGARLPLNLIGWAVVAAIGVLALLIATNVATIGSGPALASYVWKPNSQPMGFQTTEDLPKGRLIGGFAQAIREDTRIWEHQAVWTGKEMFVWGEGGAGLYNPTTDTWRKVSLQGAPTGRRYSVLVWTGQEVIVLSEGSEGRPSGARYNPTTDSWKPIATPSMVTSIIDATAVWTGKEMIVFWGFGYGGVAYNPTTDLWRSTAARNAPSAGWRVFSAVWTGKEVIVWGGSLWADLSIQNVGARYNPDTDKWAPISSVGAPTPRIDPMVVWTGHEMLVLGGLLQPVPNSLNHTRDPLMTEAYYANDGARYDPSTDTWSPIPPTTLLPKFGYLLEDRAVWTGQEVIVWGTIWPTRVNACASCSSYQLGHVLQLVQARFNPQTGIWSPLPSEGAPRIPALVPNNHAVVWDGKEMIVFGAVREDKEDDNTLYYTFRGARYTPPGTN